MTGRCDAKVRKKLCKSIIKGFARGATVKSTRCWQIWKKNKNKTSHALTTSPARNCRDMQYVKLGNEN